MTDSAGKTDVDTAIIFTPDIEKLSSLYRTVFDLGEPMASGPDHIGFRLPSLYLGFDTIAEGTQRIAGGVSLWFRVDDLDATFARLLELGATSRYEPVIKPMGERLASVYDPDGNLVGISERRSG